MRALFTRLPWVNSTPLGVPVVPEVYLNVRYFVGGLHPRFQIAAICQNSSPGFLAQINDVIRGIARLFENRAIVGSLVLRAQKQRLDARLAKNQRQFVCAVGRIEVHQHQPRLSAAELKINPFATIGGPNAYAVTRLQS